MQTAYVSFRFTMSKFINLSCMLWQFTKFNLYGILSSGKIERRNEL